MNSRKRKYFVEAPTYEEIYETELSFFKPTSIDPLLEDKDNEDLNNQSFSYKKFKYNEEEIKNIDCLEKENLAIAEKIKQLIADKNKNEKKLDNIKQCEDTELLDLLEKHINKKGHIEHALDCSVNKAKNILEITIYACDRPSLVKEIFYKLISKEPKIDKRGTETDMENHSRVVVTLKLRDRDTLVNELNKVEEIENIPESRKLFER